jgi:glycosyltransferase involved in cell wall biosynthesis
LTGGDGNLEILDLAASSQDFLSFLKCIHQIRELIHQKDIQVVNCHSSLSHILGAAVRIISWREFALIRTRGEAHPPRENRFNRYLFQRLTDHLVVPAEILKQGITLRRGLHPHRLSCIQLGIECWQQHKGQLSDSKRAELGIGANERAVGMIGRLSPIKGHVYFIQAAKILLHRYPQTKFVIAGPDAQVTQERLKRIACQLGVTDNFIFLGIVPDLEVLISALDIGAVCSTGSETICRVLLQFMAAGKPVVGTRINGIQDVIEDNQNGFLVHPGDSFQLAEAISRLLSDSELREKMGNASRKLVESRYSLPAFADKTEKLYRQVLAEFPPSISSIAK